MKKFMTKVQTIGSKAAQIQAAIQSVPPKISQLKESVAVTAGQLQQLRTSIQSSVTDLRVDNPDHILEALQEIHDAGGTFAEAGYDLRGVDMELSPVQRLIVHLDKIEDVAHPQIRALITANQDKKTVHALLSSLLQAEAVADRVALSDLSYRTLIVHVGPIPSVRLCWRTDEEEAGTVFQSAPTASSFPGIAPTETQPSGETKSVFGQSSFFEARSVPASATSVAVAPVNAPDTVTSTTEQTPSVESAPALDWKQEALERLKKNPHASKYSR
jgi:hypothetical protein